MNLPVPVEGRTGDRESMKTKCGDSKEEVCTLWLGFHCSSASGLGMSDFFAHHCLAVRGVGRALCQVKRWVRHGAQQMVLGRLDMVLLLGVRYVVCSGGEQRRGNDSPSDSEKHMQD